MTTQLIAYPVLLFDWVVLPFRKRKILPHFFNKIVFIVFYRSSCAKNYSENNLSLWYILNIFLKLQKFVIKHNRHLRTLKECTKHSPATLVFPHFLHVPKCSSCFITVLKKKKSAHSSASSRQSVIWVLWHLVSNGHSQIPQRVEWPLFLLIMVNVLISCHLLSWSLECWL